AADYADVLAFKADVLADVATSIAELATAKADTATDLAAEITDIGNEIDDLKTAAGAELNADRTAAQVSIADDQAAAAQEKSDALAEAVALKAVDAATLAAAVAAGDAEHTANVAAAAAVTSQAIPAETAKAAEKIEVNIEILVLRGERAALWAATREQVAQTIGSIISKPFDSRLDEAQSWYDWGERLETVHNNATATGSSSLWAATQVIGVAFYDTVGVGDLYSAWSGEEYITFEKLGPWERAMYGVSGAVKLATTVATGLRGRVALVECCATAS
ncbi:MAG: hypothetical protein ABI614_28080, partial [Planctomycetota bacterium]